MKILVCNPAFFNVTYSINPWMLPENGVSSSKAISQWADLVRLLEHVGAEVIHMSGRQNLPDIVFTANAGLFSPTSILLSSFKHPERQPEKEVYKDWFESHGYPCVELPEGSNFEGAGDVLARPGEKQLFQGHGFRTDESVYDGGIWSLLYQGYRFVRMELVDPYFYHLDTCFCPLPGDYALIYPAAFSKATIERIQFEPTEFLVVPAEEAKKFACNAVSVGNCVIIPSGCPETKKMLEGAGYEVFDTDMSEYIKSGGACKCLTFKLDSNN